MMLLIRKLYRDGNYRMSLLLGCGSFFGLRISDLLTLSWDMLLYDDQFTIREKKTGKRRVVKINSDFQRHTKNCYRELRVENDTEKCFLSQKGCVYSIKTFGRKVFEGAGGNANLALVRLSELFNHSSVSITKIYLGIRQDELLETYDMLDF